MKKILTFLMLFAASNLLLITITDVHANEPSAISDYQDLFYDIHEDTFEVHTYIDEETPSEEGFIIGSYMSNEQKAFLISNYEYIIDIYGFAFDSVALYSDPVYKSVSKSEYNRLEFLFNVKEIETNTQTDVQLLSFDLTNNDFQDMGTWFILDNTFTLTIKYSIPKYWTQAYDYGRIRTNSSTLYLNHQPSENAAFLSHIESNNKIWVPSIDVGDEIVMQSPYTNFSVSYADVGYPRTYLVEQENIAAVKMIKNSSDNTDYTFVLYYWESGGVTSRVVSNVNLANRNNLNIKFDGGVRKAIDYQDVMVANVDDLVPLNDFLQYLTAFDPIDGDISDQITVLDDGGYLPEQVGVYNVEFEVTNSQEQQTTIIIPIHVVDIVSPVITGSTDVVNISYDQTFNVTNWVNSLTVTDNYYTGLSISIKENTYTVNKSVIGTYHITVEAVDPSGYKGTLTRTINVTDGIGPVFDGINTITASINENLTAEQIKAGLAAVDAIDGNVTSSITIDSDGLLGNQNTPGTYQVVFRAEDLTGNHTLHTVEVTIVSSPPGFYILNSNSVRLLPGADLTIEQILTLLGVSGATEISTNYDASKPGTYNLSFTFGGEVHTLSITVLGQNDAPIPTPTVPDDQQTNTRLIIIILVTAFAVSLIGYTLVRKYKK